MSDPLLGRLAMAPFNFRALAARAPQGPYLGEVTVRRKACGRRGEVPYSESGFHLPLQLTLPPLSAGSDKRLFEVSRFSCHHQTCQLKSTSLITAAALDDGRNILTH